MAVSIFEPAVQTSAMKSRLVIFTASVSVLLLAACASGGGKPAKEEKPPAAEGPKLVGRIASVPADRRFVLIQSYGEWTAATGAILTTRGPEERTANLRTTGESLGDFAAADLQSGTVEVGDAVYSQHLPKPPPAIGSPEAAEGQSAATFENVQKNN